MVVPALLGVLPILFVLAGPSLLLDQRRVSLPAFDTIVMVLAGLVTLVVVLGFGTRGVVVGAVGAWLTLGLEGWVLATHDPAREGAMLDSLWLVGGLPVCLLVCAVVGALARLVPRRSTDRRAR